MIYGLMRALMRAITRVYLVGLFKVIGVENIPRSGPLLICPNHSATLDPPLVPASAVEPALAGDLDPLTRWSGAPGGTMRPRS